MNELAIREENNELQVLPDYAILNPEIPMSQKVNVATNVANTLAPLVRDQGLSVKGLNKKAPEKEYVTVEGWEVLGTMLGIVPVTTIVEHIEHKGRIIGYKARATLYRNPIIKDDEIVGGTVIARAEAQADESGFQKDKFAIASMAQTRALGKAYRMGLSWIIKMAGFEPTFAEDMPNFRPQKNTYEPAPMSRSTKPKSKPVEAEVVEAEIVDVTPESATVVDEGIIDVVEVVEKLCNELKGKGVPCRKAKLIQLSKARKCPDFVINHIKTLNNDDLKKYDE